MRQKKNQELISFCALVFSFPKKLDIVQSRFCLFFKVTRSNVKISSNFNLNSSQKKRSKFLMKQIKLEILSLLSKKQYILLSFNFECGLKS